MQSILIKKYSNNKLYITRGNTEKAGYINIKDLIQIIKKGKDIKVLMNGTGEDITSKVLSEALKHVGLDTPTLMQLLRNS